MGIVYYTLRRVVIGASACGGGEPVSGEQRRKSRVRGAGTAVGIIPVVRSAVLVCWTRTGRMTSMMIN